MIMQDMVDLNKFNFYSYTVAYTSDSTLSLSIYIYVFCQGYLKKILCAHIYKMQ